MKTASSPNSNLYTEVPVSSENPNVGDSKPVDLGKIFNRGGSAGELLIGGLHNLSLKLSEGQNAFIGEIDNADREALFAVNEEIAKLEAKNLRGVSNEERKLNAAREKLNDLSSAILGDGPDLNNLKALEALSATAQMAYGSQSIEDSKGAFQKTGEAMRTAKLRYKIALGIGITAAVAGATVLSGGFIAPALVGGGLRSLRSFLNAQGRKGVVQDKARNGALDVHESAIEAILSERNTGGNAAETIALAKSGAEGVGYVKMHLGKIGLALFKSAEKGTNPNNRGISNRLSAAKLGLSESGFATQERGTGLEAALNGRNMERFSSFMTMLGVAGVALRFAGIIGHIEQAGASVAESASVAKSSLTPGMKSSEIIETLKSRGFSVDRGIVEFKHGSAQELRVERIEKLISNEKVAGVADKLMKNPETAVAFSRFATPSLMGARGRINVDYLTSRGFKVEGGLVEIGGKKVPIIEIEAIAKKKGGLKFVQAVMESPETPKRLVEYIKMSKLSKVDGWTDPKQNRVLSMEYPDRIGSLHKVKSYDFIDSKSMGDAEALTQKGFSPETVSFDNNGLALDVLRLPDGSFLGSNIKIPIPRSRSWAVEAKIKFPERGLSGSHSAFWTAADGEGGGPAPKGGEIDAAENYGDHTTTDAVIHTGARNTKLGSNVWPIEPGGESIYEPEDVTTLSDGSKALVGGVKRTYPNPDRGEWHAYRIEVKPDKVTILMDGEEVSAFESDNPAFLGSWPFSDDKYSHNLRLSNAIQEYLAGPAEADLSKYRMSVAGLAMYAE